MTAAISKEKLEQLEAELGLDAGDLTYQLRCSRVSTLQKGEPWEAPKITEIKRGTIETPRKLTMDELLKQHPLYGKRLLITPMMTQDKNRSIYFDEPIGPDLEVEEVSAGPMLLGASSEVDRMTADYKIIRSNPSRTITAKTTLPKSGQEISWDMSKEIVPVVRGNDGQRGYIWIMATHTRQYEGTVVQFYGLKTLITQEHPELLPRFAGKPVMMYVDGLVLAASIPQTEAILKEHRRKELQDAKLGLV